VLVGNDLGPVYSKLRDRPSKAFGPLDILKKFEKIWAVGWRRDTGCNRFAFSSVFSFIFSPSLFSLSRSSFPKKPYFLSIFFLFLFPSAVRIHTAGIMFFILLRFLQLFASHSASGTDLSFFIFFSFKSSRVFNLFYY
jgi:hypothetical protein